MLFYGNELSTGLIFTVWLLWTAAGSRIGGKLWSSDAGIRMLLTVLAMLLPATILWIRASKTVWHIPTGEALTPVTMLAVSVSVMGPFCIVSGVLFAITWAASRELPIRIYAGEALGALGGGLCFYFVSLPLFSALTTSLITSALLLTVVFLSLAANRWRTHRYAILASSVIRHPSFVIFLLISVCLCFRTELEQMSRKWQWGPHVVAVRDTPFHNLAVLKTENQITVFANGLWLFSSPAPQQAETAVHPVMLQHPSPKTVLLIGGVAAGIPEEILKYPDVTHLDMVESDPEVLTIRNQVLGIPDQPHSSIAHLFLEDAGTFIRRSQQTYDVILMAIGDPVNADTNRFYTSEFFNRIKTLLNPGGIFSFALSASPNVIGEAEIQFLRSVYQTLHGVFPHILMYSGENACFLATDAQGKLTKNPDVLIQRMVDRNLLVNTVYVREFYLVDLLSPFRADYFSRVFEASRSDRMNRDFSPVCYFYNLIILSAQLHPGLKGILNRLAATPLHIFQAGLIAIIVGTILGWKIRRPKPETAVSLSVGTVGGALMAEQLVLILGFQILAGFVYRQLALILAFYMAGLSVGALMMGQVSGSLGPKSRIWLVGIQGGVGIHLIGSISALVWLHATESLDMVSAIIIGLSVTGGMMGGMHFSIAAHVFSEGQTPQASGSILYAADLAGGAVGALGASLFLLPVYGLFTTLLTAAALVFGSLMVLRIR